MGGSPLTSGIGAGTSGAGDVLQGFMQARAMRKNASLDMAEARANAQARLDEGRKQGKRQVTQVIKSGFVLGDSPMQIVEQSSLDAELDAMNILKGGAMRKAQQRGQAVRSIFSGVGKAFGRGSEYFMDED